MEVSARFRYRTLPRLMRGLGVLAAVGVVVLIGAKVLPSSSGPQEAPIHPGKPMTDKPERTVKLSPEVVKVAARFVHTAVYRRDLTTAWKLAGPPLRAGMTLEEWKSGNIPVVPYPVGAIAPKIKIAHSWADDALLQLALFPKPGVKQRPQVFFIQLHRYPTANGKAAWRVTSWAPYAQSGTHAIAG